MDQRGIIGDVMKAERPQGTLKSLTQQLALEVNTLREINGEFSRNLGRLLNPTPSTGNLENAKVPHPIADCVEAELHDIFRQLQSLRQDISENVSRLSGAV